MKKIDQDVADLIPISESVKLLDEQYPWLANLKWNSKEDEESSEEDKNGI